MPLGSQTEHRTWVSQDQGVIFARLLAILGRDNPRLRPLLLSVRRLLTQSSPG